MNFLIFTDSIVIIHRYSSFKNFKKISWGVTPQPILTSGPPCYINFKQGKVFLMVWNARSAYPIHKNSADRRHPNNNNNNSNTHGGPEARIGRGVTPQEIFLKFLNEEYLWIITMLSVKIRKFVFKNYSQIFGTYP